MLFKRTRRAPPATVSYLGPAFTRSSSRILVFAVYKSLDDIMTKEMTTPHHVAKPKETVAFLGYSSGTSGKAKGVRTSAYNMTSVLSILKPLDITHNDTHLAVLPLNRAFDLAIALFSPSLSLRPVYAR